MIACGAPDTEVGVALRISTYLDCQARALGENGFQALAGGPIVASLLSGLVTIFVALIGYRLILNQPVALRDTVGWAVRLGFTLALVTSWPAFQTLIYRVAVDAPAELAVVVLPSSGLPVENLDTRVQAAYDTLRLGPSPEASTSDPAPGARAPQAGAETQPPIPQPAPRAGAAQLAFPQTASALVVTTSGFSSALKIAIGFLLAVGPLAALALLFNATLGLFEGWLRALAGTALGVLASTIVTALHLTIIEGELGRLQRYAGGMVLELFDSQALPTIVLLFGIVMLAAVWAAARMGSAIRLPRPQVAMPAVENRSNATESRSETAAAAQIAPASRGAAAARDRASAVADALTTTTQREQGASASRTMVLSSSGNVVGSFGSAGERDASDVPLRTAGRRSMPRRTRSAARRDRAQ